LLHKAILPFTDRLTDREPVTQNYNLSAGELNLFHG